MKKHNTVRCVANPVSGQERGKILECDHNGQVDEHPANTRPTSAFTEGVWSEHTIPASQYRDPLLEHVRFRAGGAVLSIDQAESIYTSLRRTPFVSLYGRSNWYDDLAEYVAVYHFTEVLKQPFRIVIRKEGEEIFLYEPMKSDLVRSRAAQMKRFYKEEG